MKDIQRFTTENAEFTELVGKDVERRRGSVPEMPAHMHQSNALESYPATSARSVLDVVNAVEARVTLTTGRGR